MWRELCLDFFLSLWSFCVFCASLVAQTTRRLMRRWSLMRLQMHLRMLLWKYKRQHRTALRRLRKMGLQPLTLAEILSVQPMVAPTRLQFKFKHVRQGSDGLDP